MDIDSLKKITIGDISNLFELDKLSVKQAMPKMREFRDKHKLTDREAIEAFKIAQKIFAA